MASSLEISFSGVVKARCCGLVSCGSTSIHSSRLSLTSAKLLEFACPRTSSSFDTFWRHYMWAQSIIHSVLVVLYFGGEMDLMKPWHYPVMTSRVRTVLSKSDFSNERDGSPEAKP